MDKILGQEDIDALFAAGGDGKMDVAAALARPVCELYNFRRVGQMSNDQMRAIRTVNDLFARNLVHTVGAWLRTEFEMTMVSAEQMLYTEFVERIPERTYMCSIRLEPLGAIGLLELELALASPMVDLLLGGTGKSGTEERALTDIEELIMASVAQIIVKELNVAWAAVGLHFAFEKREASSQVAKLMSPSEKTFSVSFEARMPEQMGALNLCLPAVVLNTILREVITERERPRRSPELQGRLRTLVGQATVGAALQFPPVRLPTREIAALAPGSLVRLPVPRHAAAELRVGGLSLGAARPVRMGDHRGARLEELALPHPSHLPHAEPAAHAAAPQPS